MPTRSTKTKRSPLRAATFGFAYALCASSALAHEVGSELIPEIRGWRVDAAAALRAAEADGRWPAPPLPGAPGLGMAPRRSDGDLRLEHATLGAALRLDARYGAQWVVGQHDRDKPHTESALLQARWALGADILALNLGRDTVRMGATLDGAGHFDRFSQAPLAKRGVLDDQWIDDGLTLRWQRDVERGLRTLEAGLWRGRSFPGAAAGALVPTLRAHGGWDHWDLQLFASHLEPEARGSAMQSIGAEGHSHGSLDCRAGLAQRVCFDGRSELLGASLRWENDDGALSASLAGLLRHERGALYSLSSTADYRTTAGGWWADFTWSPWQHWILAARAEHLVPRNRLNGAGSTQLAREAGLLAGQPADRFSVAILRQLGWGAQLALEAGSESQVDGRRLSHVAMRLIWRAPELLKGRW